MASTSIQEVVNDAKKLASRLKKHDVAADGLIARAQALEKTVDSMKEVCVTVLPPSCPISSLRVCLRVTPALACSLSPVQGSHDLTFSSPVVV